MSEQEQPTSVVEPVGHQGARVEIQQRQVAMITGWLGVAAVFGLAGATYAAIQTHAGVWAIALPIIAFGLIATSIVTVSPGQSRVVQFFGTYVGTVRRPGLWCVWPLTVRRAVSIRVRNFETNRLKVNDADGNPVEIAAIVVWQVADTAKAVYAVDDYPAFVSIQSEVGAASCRQWSSLRGHPGRRHQSRAAQPTPSLTNWPERSPSEWPSRGSRWWRFGSATSPTPPRSPRRCCGASRPTPWLPRGRGSSRVRWAWWRWPSAG